MIINLTRFLHAVSQATDYVEKDILNIPGHHVKRVAVMTNRMATSMGMDGETVYDLTQAAVLHDCALNEYIQDELTRRESPEGAARHREINMADHCIAGEHMALKFPFYNRVEGAVLYHHERADGKGALGKRAEETPIYGQLIHIADRADAFFGLNTMNRTKFNKLRGWIQEQSGRMFSAECCALFLDHVDYDLLRSITGDHCVETLDTLLPDIMTDIPVHCLREMSTIFADITDYKSHFTCRHSMGIAEKAERMGQYYGYSEELCDKLYIAGALHDVGKLLISNEILEKPDKLTQEEFRAITNHALGTWEMLKDIDGMEDITRWAALHHEKLDGSGYPFGYTAEKLNHKERLMACIDIYQALREERPYKKGMPHQEAIGILRSLGSKGKLDSSIVRDIDDCFG